MSTPNNISFQKWDIQGTFYSVGLNGVRDLKRILMFMQFNFLCEARLLF